MADPSVAETFVRLVDIMARLRAPGGCPWDREQTAESLRPYLLEEAYEVLEAIEHGDTRAVCEELGDVLLQIVFQSEVPAEAGPLPVPYVGPRGEHAAGGGERGALRLTLTSAARHLGVRAEMALRDATARLGAGVRYCEAAGGARGTALADLDRAERDSLWDAAKAAV